MRTDKPLISPDKKWNWEVLTVIKQKKNSYKAVISVIFYSHGTLDYARFNFIAKIIKKKHVIFGKRRFKWCISVRNSVLQ